MIKLLILPRYGRLGASSRLRTLQYVPYLRASGFEIELLPLLGNAYLTGLYNGKFSKADVASSYMRRVHKLLSSYRYDLIWIEKELLPWLPALVELALVPRTTVLVVDYDDAVFHRYDEHRSRLVRRVLGRKIDAVMQRANVVTAGNAYLAQRARDAGCCRVEWLPTVIDLDRYPAAREEKSARPVVVGWIGSPSTAGYLEMVAPALIELGRTQPLRCVAIGARPDQLVGTPFEAWEWTEVNEVALLHQLDIGIMPLPDAPWERGKCGYKLIQYMGCTLPVVASPVGVNRDIVREGENGFLATNTGDWICALKALIDDGALRRRMGEAGRRQVEQVYCLQVQASRLANIFQDAVSRGSV